VFIIVGLSLLGDSMLYTVIPAQIEAMPFSISQMSLLLSANRFIRLFSNYWAARIYKIHGQKYPFSISVIVAILITFGYGLSQTFWYFLFLRILWGVCYSFLRLKSLLVIFTSKINKSGEFTGKYRAFSRTGDIIGTLFAGILADRFGFQITTIVFGFISTISLILLFKIHQIEPNNKNYNNDFLSNEYARIGFFSNFKKILNDFKILSLMLMGFTLYFMIQGLIKSSYGIYISYAFESSLNIMKFNIGIATLNGFILSSRPFIELFLSASFGRLIDKYLKSKFLFILFFLQGVFFILLGLYINKYLTLLIPFLLFINSSLITIMIYTEIGNYNKYDISDRMANYTTSNDLGSAFGPVSLVILNFGISLQVLYFMFGIFIIIISINYLYNYHKR